MREYMLLLRGSYADWQKQSPEGIQEVMSRYGAWLKELRSEDRFVSGTDLAKDRKRLVPTSGGIVVDGPYSETKEAVTGYFLIRARSLAEA